MIQYLKCKDLGVVHILCHYRLVWKGGRPKSENDRGEGMEDLNDMAKFNKKYTKRGGAPSRYTLDMK